MPDSFLPPGHHPLDQARGSKNPMDYHLDRVSTHVKWNCEHLATFLHDREADPDNAEREIRHLDDSIKRGYEHLLRLTELLRAGYHPTTKNQ